MPQAGDKTVDLTRERPITNLCPIFGQNDGGLPFVCVDEEIREGLHGYLLGHRLELAGILTSNPTFAADHGSGPRLPDVSAVACVYFRRWRLHWRSGRG